MTTGDDTQWKSDKAYVDGGGVLAHAVSCVACGARVDIEYLRGADGVDGRPRYLVMFRHVEGVCDLADEPSALAEAMVRHMTGKEPS